MRPGLLFKHSFVSIVVLLVILFGATSAMSQTTSFTYQGRLTDGGTAANGNYDLQFALFDSLSGGTQIGSTQTLNTVAVSNGIFSVTLDFGASSFNGASRFLEINARLSGAGSFTLLTPRQQLTSTPYAVRSVSAANADGATNAQTATNATQLGGVAASQYVQTNDSRLSDLRSPTPGSANYIQTNPSAAQNANFNITGAGSVGGTLSGSVVNAATQFNIGGIRVFGVSGTSQEPNSNTFAGDGAGGAITPLNDGGSGNSFFGKGAGQATSTGFSNSFFGINAGHSNVSSGGNAFFGFNAGLKHTSGIFNAFFGADAGQFNQSGANNTAIGGFTDVGLNLNNATAIGAGARVDQSDSLVLGSINGVNLATADTNVGIGTTTPRSALEVKRNWDGSFGAITVTGDRPTIRFSGGSIASNDQWILHLGSAAGTAPAGSLSFFFGGTAGTSFGSPILSVTPSGTVEVTNLGSAGGTQLCRNSSNEISTCSSSLRYKTDVALFRGGLDVINRLRPISFTWKQDGVQDIGLGAEEVEKVAPLLTFRNAKGEIEGVKYNQLSAVFINAFKEQQIEIKQQQEQLKLQQEQIKRQEHQASQERAAFAAQQRELVALKTLVCRSHRRASVCK